VTTWAVPAAIVRPHPGQVYALTAFDAETGCTVHSAPRRVSERFHPAISRSRESSDDEESGRRRCERGMTRLAHHQWLRVQKSYAADQLP
jgi:hypothetical protein